MAKTSIASLRRWQAKKYGKKRARKDRARKAKTVTTSVKKWKKGKNSTRMDLRRGKTLVDGPNPSGRRKSRSGRTKKVRYPKLAAKARAQKRVNGRFAK